MQILAIDLGSSSVRALLYTASDAGVQRIEGREAQQSYAFETDASGKAIIAADTLRGYVEACIDEMMQGSAADDIQAVGLDTFAGNWLAVDEANQPLTPVITYADTRSHTPQIASPAEMHQRTGAPLNAAYYPAQINLLDTLVDDTARVHQIIDVGTWLYRGWFGRDDVPMSYSLASWSGLLNRAHLAWDTVALDAIGIPREVLAPLADYTQAQQGLLNDYTKRWSGLADASWYLAVGDGAAAQVGSNAITEDSAALTIGTTAALRKVNHGGLPHVPDGGWSYYIDADHHLLGGALSEGGNIFAWARDTLQFDADALETALSHRSAGQHKLTVLPLLNGERSPGWRGDATGTLHGLRLSTSALDIVQALMESVALRLAQISHQIDLSERKRIMASGGALHHSRAWAQIVADALGHPLHMLDEPEITALGTAQLVWCALRGGSISGAHPPVREIITPREDHHAAMQNQLRDQQALYQQLWQS